MCVGTCTSTYEKKLGECGCKHVYICTDMRGGACVIVYVYIYMYVDACFLYICQCRYMSALAVRVLSVCSIGVHMCAVMNS